LLHQALSRPTQPAVTLLAHAPLVLQAGTTGLQALAGPLSTLSLRTLPPQASHEPVPASTHGLVLVAVAPPDAQPPQGDAACEAWLQQQAPGFRLASAAINPALVLLWLRLDGQASLLFRHGLPQTGAGAPRWVPVPQLQLPGGGMQRVDFGAPISQPAHAEDDDLSHTERAQAPDTTVGDNSDNGDDGRDVRHAAAFGAARLRQLQRSHIVLVGAGRVGSVVAHGLVRLGVQRLTVIEPDHMEPHNDDGDVAPHHEGRPKVEALQRFVRGLQRPGAVLDLQRKPVASAAAGACMAQADAVVVCVDNDAARLWANAWALAHNRCLLAVATSVQVQGAEADLRLLPAGSGCLACVGGYVQRSELLQQLAMDGPVPTPADFREQRLGSLRSWSALAAHLGQRLLEEHLLRPGGGALFRQLLETPHGGLQVRDWRPEADEGRLRACPFCSRLQGAGQAAVTPQRLRALVRQWLEPQA
jgi:hypothetical protein